MKEIEEESGLKDVRFVSEDENSQIGWVNVDEIKEKSTEKWFVDRIYSKLCEKVVTYEKI